MRGIRLINEINKEFNITLACCNENLGDTIYYNSEQDPLSIRLICRSDVYYIVIFTKNLNLINKGMFKTRDKLKKVKIKQLIYEALSK